MKKKIEGPVYKKSGISIKRAKEILERSGSKYTDEQVSKIIDLLELFVEAFYRNYIKHQHYEQEGDIVHSCFNGRASG